MIKVRCSAIGKIMTEPKLKADKDAGNLSETAKTYIREQWLFDNFGYRESVMTDEMMKGILCEQDSMSLVQRVLGGEFRMRFNNNISNHYLTGTPDIVLKDCVEDIKTSFSLRTFFETTEPDHAYIGQGQGYMELTGRKKFRLIHCLVRTPAEILLNKQKRLYYQFDCDENNPEYIRMCEQIEKNDLIIDTIPETDRVKVFEFDYDPNYIERLYNKIEKARVYYKTLKL